MTWQRYKKFFKMRKILQHFSETRDKCSAESVHRRLANEGVKKSGGASVKNGELSEDERNEMKLIQFFAV